MRINAADADADAADDAAATNISNARLVSNPLALRHQTTRLQSDPTLYYFVNLKVYLTLIISLTPLLILYPSCLFL